MQTTLTIGLVAHDGPARAAAGIRDLQFGWDLEQPWGLTFRVMRGCNADLPFVPGVPVALATDDGSGPVLRFVGDLQRPESSVTDLGVAWSYTATDLKRRADYVALTGLDGSGTAAFNLAPDDPLYLYATAGQTVGDVVAAILQQEANAAALAAAGVGAYTGLAPPTLPAATLADLAALSVVPNGPVRLAGESILNLLEQFILHYHSQYCLYVLPDGTIRVRSIFGLTPVAVALPASDGSGTGYDDDVPNGPRWPEYTGPDCTGCFTAWEIRGLDIQTAYLSQVDGTLKPAWSAADQSAWTIADFTQPRGAKDTGTASAVTSTSCTVASDQASAHWAADFWNGAAVGGWVYLDNLAGAGIDLYEFRQITSCTALSAGGTATITWDPAMPLASTGYTRYRIVGLNTPRALVGRDFHTREPSRSPTPPGNDLDLNTFVGSHFYPRNPKGMPVANASRTFTVFYPYAFVQWSPTGKWPYFEVPVNVQVNPKNGHITLAEPAVVKSCGLAGTTNLLTSRYPASAAEGLYHDVQVVIPYNRGSVAARAPASGYSGVAYTKYGIQRVFTQHRDEFTWAGDAPSMRALAAEHLATVRDPVVSGSLEWMELPTGFDALAPGFALSMGCSGATTPLDGLDLPVRGVSVRWHDEGPTLYSASLRFSNLRRPFEGDDQYIHPALSGNTFGTPDGSVFGESMMGMALDVAASTPRSPLSGAIPVGQAPAGEHPAGEHPMGADAGTNPIAAALAGSGGGGVAAGAGMGDGPGDFAGWSPGKSGDPSHVMGRNPGGPTGPPLPPGYRAPVDAAHPDSIMNMTSKAGAPIDPDSGDRPGRPGGLAERRGLRDDTQDGGGG